MIDFTEPVECDKGPITCIVVTPRRGYFSGMVKSEYCMWRIEDGQCIYHAGDESYRAKNVFERAGMPQ